MKKILINKLGISRSQKEKKKNPNNSKREEILDHYSEETV